MRLCEAHNMQLHCVIVNRTIKPNQTSINQSKHIYIALHVASDSESNQLLCTSLLETFQPQILMNEADDR